MHTHKIFYIKTFKIAPLRFDPNINFRELHCSLLKSHCLKHSLILIRCCGSMSYCADIRRWERACLRALCVMQHDTHLPVPFCNTAESKLHIMKFAPLWQHLNVACQLVKSNYCQWSINFWYSPLSTFYLLTKPICDRICDTKETPVHSIYQEWPDGQASRDALQKAP